MQVLAQKTSRDAAAKRATDGLVNFLCNVDVRHLMAADQATRDKVVAWLKSLGPSVTSPTSAASQVLAALEQAVRQQQPKPAGPHAQGLPKMPKTEPSVQESQETAPKVSGPTEAAIAMLKDGRISESTLEMFDFSSLLKDEDAKALLLDESKLDNMSSEKVRTNTVSCLPA